MGYAYGIAFATLVLMVATLPVLLLAVEARPRSCSRVGWAVAVWLIAVLGLTALGAVAVMSLADCAQQPECW